MFYLTFNDELSRNSKIIKITVQIAVKREPHVVYFFEFTHLLMTKGCLYKVYVARIVVTPLFIFCLLILSCISTVFLDPNQELLVRRVLSSHHMAVPYIEVRKNIR